MGWEVTSAAAAHSALAGVLASVTLILVPLLTPRLSSMREPRVVVLLILAFFLLVLAAIVWGSLAGQPAAVDLRDHGVSTARIAFQVGRNMATGCAAVVLLAAGALAVVTGLAEAIGDPASGASYRQADLVLRWTTVALTALAAYEVVYFLMAAVDELWASPPPSLLAVLAFLFQAAAAAAPRGVRQRVALDTGERLMRVLLIGAAVAALLALLAFVSVPVSSPLEGPVDASLWDVLSLTALAGSTLAFFVYGTSLSWFMSHSASQAESGNTETGG
jgi:hypothetical protein